MSRFENQQKAERQYKDCELRYKVVLDDLYCVENERNFSKMQEALESVGVRLELKDDNLKLSFISSKFVRLKSRNAGRRAKIAFDEKELKEGNYVAYRYADIVLMMQTMKDPDIAVKIGMPIATYYRHKKAMKESSYYNSLDLNRLTDIEYLRSVQGNYIF